MYQNYPLALKVLFKILIGPLNCDDLLKSYQCMGTDLLECKYSGGGGSNSEVLIAYLLPNYLLEIQN